MTRTPVYILAGGRSSRFGSDKARASIRGGTLLKHVADMLSPVACDLTVIADHADKYRDLGFRTIADIRPGLGPLAGLHAALADLPQDHRWLLLGSCDMFVVRRHWLEHLLANADDQRDAAAFRAQRWQPMPAMYARTTAAAVEAALDSGDRSMQHLLDLLDVAEIPTPADWPADWQVNTVHDLARQLADTK
ncbi:MAG: molybdenum cofactor guanylyltransferase [Phycisphaeraceae bacterium]|nr:molybdenum cofactor guanylyltransferase [Phycisphaeraceae bacterium]